MQLTLIKVSSIVEDAETKQITFDAGCIEFAYKGQVIELNEPLALTMTHDGMYQDVLRNVEWVIYDDMSIDPVAFKSWSVVSLVAAEGFEQAVHREVARKCKVVPLHKLVDERELFASEYEQAFKKMMGV